MENLKELHPAAQVAAIIGVCAVLCVFFYSVFKAMRES